ncbi:DUF3014 domain-containing protein [Aliidiomarina iranensis]|nr:DUF3014 domain-containing protein [Aliidiomarina iranensis]
MGSQEKTDDIQKDDSKIKQQRLIGVAIAVILIVVIALWLTRGGEPEVEPAPVLEPVEQIAEPEPMPEPEPEPMPEPMPEPEPEPLPEPEPAPEPEPEPEPLPPLNEASDVVLQELAEQEVNIQPVQAENMLRKLVVFVDNIARGEIVREAAVINGPQSRFIVQRIDGQIYVDERSYSRYNDIVSWFYEMDTDVLVDQFERFQPVFEEAFGEIKEPGLTFEERVLDAIAILLDTPEPRGLLALSDEEVMYTYADPELENLPAAQKQMLRIGPDNRALVKSKLREIRQRLSQ